MAISQTICSLLSQHTAGAVPTEPFSPPRPNAQARRRNRCDCQRSPVQGCNCASPQAITYPSTARRYLECTLTQRWALRVAFGHGADEADPTDSTSQDRFADIKTSHGGGELGVGPTRGHISNFRAGRPAEILSWQPKRHRYKRFPSSVRGDEAWEPIRRSVAVTSRGQLVPGPPAPGLSVSAIPIIARSV